MENYSLQRIIESINGNVQSQGIKVKFAAWMIMGSQEWNETPDQIKAYAYQAALVTGWTNQSLINTACGAYPHMDKYMAKFTIEHLVDLVKEHPLEIDE
jgi:hypothetical protein